LTSSDPPDRLRRQDDVARPDDVETPGPGADGTGTWGGEGGAGQYPGRPVGSERPDEGGNPEVM
jgi:hypothetical protein